MTSRLLIRGWLSLGQRCNQTECRRFCLFCKSIYTIRFYIFSQDPAEDPNHSEEDPDFSDIRFLARLKTFHNLSPQALSFRQDTPRGLLIIAHVAVALETLVAKLLLALVITIGNG